MALAATVVCRGAAFDNFSEHVIERSNEFCRRRVVTFFKLLCFGRVASRAIVGSHDYGNFVTVVIECRWIVGARLVAGIAVHAFLRMSAALPLLDDAGRGRRMAL